MTNNNTNAGRAHTWTQKENPMDNEECVPDEDEVRNLYVNHCDPAAVRGGDFNAEFDRFLAKIKGDAFAQEPTDAEIEAAAVKAYEMERDDIDPGWPDWQSAGPLARAGTRAMARAVLRAARAARRDEESR